MLQRSVRRVAFTHILTHTRNVSTAKVPRTPSSGPPAMKHPTRGGQNLTDRYRRLEKSLRGKGTYQKDISDLAEEGATLSKPHKSGPSTRTFMGFIVPEVPKPPASDDCCMSGCAICVYDLYAEAQDEYKKALEHLRRSLAALHVPEDQWPEDIQTASKSGNTKSQRKLNPTLSAFEELEARLKQKHSGDVASGSNDVATEANVEAGEQSKATRHRVRPGKDVAAELRSVYEGVRWVLFSNR